MNVVQWPPMKQYERGLITLDELVEMDPSLDAVWVSEQWRLIEEAYQRYARLGVSGREYGLEIEGL